MITGSSLQVLIHGGTLKPALKNKTNKQNYINFILRFPRFGHLNNLIHNKLKLWSKVQFMNFSVLFETEM